jgi:hypothetical protein
VVELAVDFDEKADLVVDVVDTTQPGVATDIDLTAEGLLARVPEDLLEALLQAGRPDNGSDRPLRRRPRIAAMPGRPRLASSSKVVCSAGSIAGLCVTTRSTIRSSLAGGTTDPRSTSVGGRVVQGMPFTDVRWWGRRSFGRCPPLEVGTLPPRSRMISAT